MKSWALLLFCFLALPALADAPPPMAGAGVLVRNGKADCSAALIAPDLLATAGHCISGKKLSDEYTVVFRTGAYPGHPSVERQAVAQHVHPLFLAGRSIENKNLGSDIGLIRLAEPIPDTVARPFALVSAAEAGERVLIASYPGGAGERARERKCPVLDLRSTIMLLSCVVIPGESGGPVVRITEGEPELLGIVVATGRDGHQPFGYAVLSQARLGQMRAIFAP
ncbi:MAG: trypsin-like serine protease [Pseudomonadota bacterium]